MGDDPFKSKEDRLGIFIRKLLSHSRLSADDQQAIASLPFSLRRLEPNEYILREGDLAKVCPVLLSGFAYRQKTSADGGRQIVALKIPGDALDFQSLYVDIADHNLQALTPVELAVFAQKDFEALVAPRPNIARAIIVDILIEGSISREWLLNIGRRNALGRLAHLLCELYYRVQQIALEEVGAFEFPLTQEQLADLLGLTPVHINRTIKILEKEGAVKRVSRRLTIGDVDTLRRIADFSDVYLHRTLDSLV
ncbi:Crp/Fnr family transcriptional regulator [Sphingopyxis granuli]|uniref:Crp/Fnr family transcriptional regulator n=1 Tax=Sphingopyxis granuli TaxID=267128 RepID=UPI001BAEFFDB|nr:Crp/Fnr family transcriptional regulator [Sphingopyxis granuli]QUM70784.1 Crp/Fnr family transcriptional regulator [Sphingopyxis granuli]